MNISRVIAAVLTIITSLPASQPVYSADIESSPNDNRLYRQIILANGLKATLIHDGAADTAAAAMDVAIGAGSDPTDRPGLAHFLEHMLFLGTEKYPEPDAYASFIRQHGGSNNAYTSFANTNYFFEVEATQLEAALDRFAQFFIAPLFSEDLVQRERNAVHSEFTGKRREEGLRFWSARKRGLNPQHPMTGFTTGNLETLADRDDSDIRQELIDFYQTHYSSNIMSLAILGREPLDQLEFWVREKFSTVENRHRKKQQFEIPLYTPQQLSARLNIKPLTDQRFLLLTFPVPKQPHHKFSKPRSYIGNVLGHEGRGSLLSELKRQGWVTALSAGGSTETRGATTFEISIGLTDAGTGHVEDIIYTVFEAINRLKQSGLPAWLYDENQRIDELSFRYQEKPSPASLVRSLSLRAQDWPARQLLSGPYRSSHFDKHGIETILEHLVPGNMQLIVVAPDLQTDLTTEWYDTPFSFRHLAEESVDRWNAAGLNPRIKIPEPNPFLPVDLELRADGHGDPLKLIDIPTLQVWHRTDSSFGVPRANFKANLHLPKVVSSPANNVLADIYARMVNDQLNEFSYAANIAGLGASLITNSRGFTLNMAGYADGQLQMLKSIIDVMTDLEPDKMLFEQLRLELQEEIKSDTQDAPYKQTAARTYQLLFSPYFTDKEKTDALEQISFEDIASFHRDLFDTARIVVLSHGNLTGKETLRRVELLQDRLLKHARAATVERIHMVKLPPLQQFADRLDIDHADSSISLYVQSLSRDRITRARYAVLRQLLSQPLYTELRTRQQLGYFVFTYSIDLIQVPSVVIALQSPVAGPGKLYDAVEKFLSDFKTQLDAMSEQEFKRHVQAVVSQIQEEDTRLRHRTNRYWGAIIREDYRFDATALFAEALQGVSKNDITALYKQLFTDKKNPRLVVYSEGKSAKARADEHTIPPMESVVSLSHFKRGKVLMPPLSEVEDVDQQSAR